MKKIKKHIQRARDRREAKKTGVSEDVPRITNNTVAAHRDEVLGNARKYIYPLEHSKHRIVVVSTTLFIVTLVGFFTYCTLALYRMNNTSTFLYRVTQVIPFPIARTSNRFIAYENYLFEVRRYQHYYETQLKVDFKNEKDKEQLEQSKRRALEKVVNDAYIKQLAEKHDIAVTDKEVDDQIAVARSQNRLGGNEKVFEDVLQDYWGWSIHDFKRSLRQQLLAEKVVATLDTETNQRAQAALSELKSGADFAEVAKKYSDDESSKGNGGEYGFAIDRTSRISPQATDALFKLKDGEYSGIINTGASLEIFKTIERNEEKVRAAHIVFNYKNIESYINDLKEKQRYTVYIRLAEPPAEPELPEAAPGEQVTQEN